jgi:hypothetical protein
MARAENGREHLAEHLESQRPFVLVQVSLTIHVALMLICSQDSSGCAWRPHLH